MRLLWPIDLFRSIHPALSPRRTKSCIVLHDNRRDIKEGEETRRPIRPSSTLPLSLSSSLWHTSGINQSHPQLTLWDPGRKEGVRYDNPEDDFVSVSLSCTPVRRQLDPRRDREQRSAAGKRKWEPTYVRLTDDEEEEECIWGVLRCSGLILQ